jgi:hypothetical protein
VTGFAVLATAAASMAGNRPSPVAENRMTYFADSLFRSDRSNDLTAADRSYLDRMVETRAEWIPRRQVLRVLR